MNQTPVADGKEGAVESPAIVAVGSVALDTVETPFGKAEEILGGSAVYFSLAASLFSRPGVVAVVGGDLPEDALALLRNRGVDLAGLQVVPEGRTFRWAGKYSYDMNTRTTLKTELNVFERFKPELPPVYGKAPFLFLGNIDPNLQLAVLDQMEAPRLIACDTMNYWIEKEPESLRRLLGRIDLLVINDEEARELGGHHNLMTVASRILSWGPSTLIIKKGEHGAIMARDDSIFALPAYPLEEVYDPTGAGDAFAGALMGYLAGADNLDEGQFRGAILYGSAVASLCVEGFGVERLLQINREGMEERAYHFRRLTAIDRSGTSPDP